MGGEEFGRCSETDEVEGWREEGMWRAEVETGSESRFRWKESEMKMDSVIVRVLGRGEWVNSEHT